MIYSSYFVLISSITVFCFVASNAVRGAENVSAASNVALEPLYDMTDGFLRITFPKDGIDMKALEYVISLAKGEKKLNSDELIKEALRPYAGYATCIVLGFLSIIIMPLVGCFCCCCRSCNKCGGKTPSHDPKNAKCKRISCGFLLFVFSIVMLGGMVMVFFSSQKLHELIEKEEISTKLNSALDGLKFSLKSTYEQDLVGSIKVAVNGIKDAAVGTINNSSRQFTDNLFNITGAGDIGNISTNLSTVDFAGNLDVLGSELTKLSNHIKEAQTTVERIQNDSSQLNCSGCDVLNNTLQKISLNISVEEYLKKVNDSRQKLKDSGNPTDLFDTIKTNITGRVETSMEGAKQKINQSLPDVNQIIADLTEQGNQLLEEVDNTLANVKIEATKIFHRPETKLYSGYVWYALIAIGSIIALIILLYLVGLLLGCGERPGPESSSCNKGTGANLIMAAVGLSFIFFWLFMILTWILFVPGAFITSQFCWFVKDPTALVNQLQLSSSDITFGNISLKDIANTYSDCLNNKTILKTSAISRIISEDRLRSTVADKLNSASIRADIGNISVDFNTIELFPTALNDSLNDLLNLNSSDVNITEIFQGVEQLLINETVIQLIGNLTNSNTTDPADKQRLRSIQGNLESLNDSITEMQRYKGSLTSLINESSLWIDDLKAASRALRDKLVNVSAKVQTDGANLTKTLTSGLVDNVVNTINGSVESALNKVFSVTCGKIGTASRNTLNVVCDTALNPLNGIWFSLGWCLALFIPAIITGLCVVSLFRRQQSYDPNFKDDNMSDNADNIPLESAPRYPNPSHRGYGYAGEVHNPGYYDDSGLMVGGGGHMMRDGYHHNYPQVLPKLPPHRVGHFGGYY